MQIILAFIISLFTAITLRTPPSAWIPIGVTGMLGWATSAAAMKLDAPELVASLASAVVIGTIAEIMARVQKHPVTIYIVSGIIPLAPGITAYNSMLAFVENRFDEGIKLAFKAFLIASYISFGLAIVPVLARRLKTIMAYRRSTHKP